MEKLVIVALGGNALQAADEAPTYENQRKNVETAVENIIDLITRGFKVVVTHGNGPQVGRLLIQNEVADSESTPSFPFDAVDAMSQATIGYQIAQVMQNMLAEKGINKNVVTVLTQVEVSPDDPGFQNPTKPIGAFYTKEEAQKLADEKGYVIKEDSNRGYRRVVASPQPISIIEEKSIKDLLDNDNIVIAAGGGGIPVFKENNTLTGTAAVIDKDKATSLLAKRLKADYLVILTAVEQAYINFGKENQESLHKVDIATLNKHIADEQFAKGSMLPKVEAVIDFVEETNNTAIITNLESVVSATCDEATGTIVK